MAEVELAVEFSVDPLVFFTREVPTRLSEPGNGPNLEQVAASPESMELRLSARRDVDSLHEAQSRISELHAVLADSDPEVLFQLCFPYLKHLMTVIKQRELRERPNRFNIR